MGAAGNQEILTPHLDRLASEGAYFPNFFCASPVCSPARASILIGLAPSRHGIYDWIRAPILRDGRMEIDERYLTDVVTEGALEFLDRYGQGEQPLYLSVHYTAPHSPWDQDQHPEELQRLYDGCPFGTCPEEGLHPWQINSAPRGVGARRRELLTGYYASITGVDRGVGLLLAWLDAHGLREQTLVVFTGDNGMKMGHDGIWGKGNGTFPQNMYDTSGKVPFLAAHLGRIPTGVVATGCPTACIADTAYLGQGQRPERTDWGCAVELSV